MSAEGEVREFLGAQTGQGVSVIIVDSNTPGEGPALHRHPYPETFVLISGTVQFWVDDQEFLATAPSVQCAPAHAPHRFRTTGAEPVRMVNIHANPTFVTEWL